jgi:hypothetical protein
MNGVRGELGGGREDEEGDDYMMAMVIGVCFA